MAVLVDAALLRNLADTSGWCQVEVVGAPETTDVGRGLDLAARLLSDVRHPEQPGEPFVHDSVVRQGENGPVLCFDAADAEAYPGVLEALVARVLAGLDAAGVTEGQLRPVPTVPATAEPPASIVAAAAGDRAFLREQLSGFPWPPDATSPTTSGQGPLEHRCRELATSSATPLEEAAASISDGLSREPRFVVLTQAREETPYGLQHVIGFRTRDCLARAALTTLEGRTQIWVELVAVV